jgi:hypothetical protein
MTTTPLVHVWPPTDEAGPWVRVGSQHLAGRAGIRRRSDAIARVSYITLLVGPAVYRELCPFFASTPRDRPGTLDAHRQSLVLRASESVCTPSLITVHGRIRYQPSRLSFQFRPGEPTILSPACWRNRSHGRRDWLHNREPYRGGRHGAEAVSSSAPDGSTLLIHSNAVLTDLASTKKRLS